ncbi:MAG: hypothetical protein U1E89_02445 [Burkholderiaceae bacterium]
MTFTSRSRKVRHGAPAAKAMPDVQAFARAIEIAFDEFRSRARARA